MARDCFEIFQTPEFYSEYFEKKPFFAKGTDKRCSLSDLSVENFDAYLARRLYASDIRIAKAGESMSPFSYTYSKGPTHGRTECDDLEVDVPRIMAAYAKGYSIILHQMESISPRVLEARSFLEKLFQSSVQCNAYLTPSFAQGLPTHYDSHDVIIFQIYGQKTWTIYEAAEELPNETAEISSLGQEIWSDRLEPGDILYIPRGFPHHSKTDASASGHITFGINPPKIGDLLRFFVETIQQKMPSLRNSVVPLKASTLPSVVEAVVQELSKTLDDEQTRLDLIRQFQAKRKKECSTGRLGSFLSISRLPSINDRTILRRNENLNISTEDRGGKTILKYGGAQLEFPPTLKPLVNMILSQSSFALAAIPMLSLEQKTRFASKLVSEGILFIHEEVLQ